MKYLVRNVATERLCWILAGLDGQEDWSADAADAIAPEFAEMVSPSRVVEMLRQLSSVYAPVAVVGFDIRERRAKARIRDHDGGFAVVSCTVEPEPPHRITATSITGLVPENLPSRLPMEFTGYPFQRQSEGARLIVFSGLPGTGKSTLADATGRRLHTPVFGADWLLGSLTPFGLYHLDERQDIGAELLTTLALRQLILGQSAILDFPTEDPVMRTRWRTLAEQTGSDFKVIACICSDLQTHRARLDSRERGIPGWHEGGNWPSIDRRLAEFVSWKDDVLTVDSMQSYESNLAAVLDYLSYDRSGSRTQQTR